MALTLPSPWVTGEKIKASRLNSFNTSIQSKFGDIRSVDLASNAGIKGGQIAAYGSGQAITNNNLENNSVDARVLKSDVAAGHATAAVTRNHIVSGELQADHYGTGSIPTAALAALAVTQGKLNLTTAQNAAGIGPLASGAATLYGLGISSTTTLPLIAWQTNAYSVTFTFAVSAGQWAILIRNAGATSITLSAGELHWTYIS